MIKRNLFLRKCFLPMLLLGICTIFSSCSSDDDDTGGGTNIKGQKGSFLIAVKGTTGEYIVQTDDINGEDIHISSHSVQLTMTDYLWSFNKGTAVGLVYQQGSPGIGYGFRLNADSTLNEVSKFQISTRFTSYGFFGDYLVTSVGGQTPSSAPNRVDGATFVLRNANDFSIAKEKTILTQDLTTNGELVTFSGIVDLGNEQFLTGMIQSGFSETSDENGGSSTGVIAFPDSVRVAVIDKDLNVVRTFGDNRISYSSGRFRSQYYSQIGKTDDGTIYVFSGSFEATTTLPCGALKVNSTATDFDKNYYFNIQALSDGYKFKRLWYISDHRFLLEMYNDKVPTLASEAAQYGIVDMSAKTFNWITGLPSKGTVTYSGIPMVYKGQIYLPLTEFGQNAALYVVNPSSNQATKSISVIGATQIRAIGNLTVN